MEFVNPVTLIALGAIAILALALVYILINQKTDNVVIADIEAIVKPYVLQAIFAAEKISRQGLEDSRVVLAGVDRKAIAMFLYKLVPEKISVAGLEINLRQYVTPEMFDGFIERALVEADKIIKENEDKLDDLVKNFPGQFESLG